MHTYMRDRGGRIYTSEGNLILAARRAAHLNAATTSLSAYGYLYSYRKAL